MDCMVIYVCLRLEIRVNHSPYCRRPVCSVDELYCERLTCTRTRELYLLDFLAK